MQIHSVANSNLKCKISVFTPTEQIPNLEYINHPVGACLSLGSVVAH